MIRAYQPDDLEPLMAVWLAASRVGHPFLSAEQLVKDRIEIIEKYIPIARQWVVELDGVIVGFIAMLDNHIGGLFVDPTHHRRGIGAALVAHIKLMHERLTVNVFRDNHNGIAFYESVGFVCLQEQTCTHTGLPELLMEMDNRA